MVTWRFFLWWFFWTAGVAAGDVFDCAILGGFGVTFELKMADAAPVLVAKDTPIEQHLQAVQDAKAEANLSDETPFCPTLKFASRTFSLLREWRSVFLALEV